MVAAVVAGDSVARINGKKVSREEGNYPTKREREREREREKSSEKGRVRASNSDLKIEKVMSAYPWAEC